VPPNSRNEEKKTEDRTAVEREIERLARELARVVNEVPVADREELRAYAVGLVREEIRGVEAVEQGRDAEGEARASSFNPLGMGIPVLLVGAFLIFLFPPVGLLLFGLAGFLVIWGILATLFSGRGARRG
jgi:hypothetical protein